MKIWKISNNKGIIAYVKVLETCTISDTAYASLQIVRKNQDSNAKTKGNVEYIRRCLFDVIMIKYIKM